MTQSQEERTDSGVYTLGPLLEAVRRSCPPAARKKYPREMFNFLNDYRPGPVLELVVLRELPGAGLCVLIKDRLPTDIGYEGECHVPGGFMLNEETFGEALQRLAQEETGMENAVGLARMTGVMNNPVTQRGHEIHLIFLVEMWPPEFPLDEHTWWVPVDRLPANLMASHYDIIRTAREVHDGVREPNLTLEFSER